METLYLSLFFSADHDTYVFWDDDFRQIENYESVKPILRSLIDDHLLDAFTFFQSFVAVVDIHILEVSHFYF